MDLRGGLLLGLVLLSNLAGQDARDLVLAFRYRITAKPDTTSCTLQIALPPTLPRRQEVKLEFSPKPNKVFARDGNRYARFQVSLRKARVREVVLTARVRLLRYDLSVAKSLRQKLGKKGRPKPLSREARAQFLRSERFFEVDAKSIRKVAKGLGGKRDIERARSVWDYVLKTMNVGAYNPGDLGAVKTLAQKFGDCTDYSDLFIALCRAKGVPARIVDGYTIPWNDLPQHNWCEVYLEDYGWVPMDPFRGEWPGTRFDRMKNVFLLFSRLRRDATLENYHYYSYRYPSGQGVVVKHTVDVLPSPKPQRKGEKKRK